MIDTLTKEQEAQMDVYAKAGIENGLNTDRINQEEAQSIIDELYEHILEQTKVEVILCDSPYAAWKKVLELKKLDSSEYVHPYIDGHLFSYYFAFYDYMINVAGVKLDKDTLAKYNVFHNTIKLGNVYPFDDICIVAQKPTTINMVDGKLHCEDGPSIEYADKKGSVYSLNGVRVPKWLVMTKWNELDPHKFAEIDNVEVRREFVRKVGIERIVMKCGGNVIDKQGDYELIEIDLLGTTGVWPYLKMKNPSIGVRHMECVDRSCRTVDDALTWRNQSDIRPETLT